MPMASFILFLPPHPHPFLADELRRMAVVEAKPPKVLEEGKGSGIPSEAIPSDLMPRKQGEKLPTAMVKEILSPIKYYMHYYFTRT